jgi:hypothetical protein
MLLGAFSLIFWRQGTTGRQFTQPLPLTPEAIFRVSNNLLYSFSLGSIFSTYMGKYNIQKIYTEIQKIIIKITLFACHFCLRTK